MPRTVAIQYPSFGPQHPPRLKAIAEAAPTPGTRVVAMEMFASDSDYAWAPVTGDSEQYERFTVMPCSSETGRRNRRLLRRSVVVALEAIRPDAVIVNGWGHLESRMSMQWCRRNDVPMVILSDTPRYNSTRVWYKELFKKWLLRGVKGGFAAGSPQADYLVNLGLPRSGVFAPGSCVVDNDYWHSRAEEARGRAEAYRSELGLPQEYFFSNCRFLELKNLPFLVRAYGTYRRRVGAAALDLVLSGSGPDEVRIRAAIEDEQIEGVHFVGFRQVDELPAYYALCRTFILPSAHFENWGLVVNEAMACRVPVLVSTQVGSSQDLVVEGVNGHTFDPADTQQLVDLLCFMGSSEQVRAMGDAAYEKISNEHSLPVAAANFWHSVMGALGEDH